MPFNPVRGLKRRVNKVLKRAMSLALSLVFAAVPVQPVSRPSVSAVAVARVRIIQAARITIGDSAKGDIRPRVTGSQIRNGRVEFE